MDTFGLSEWLRFAFTILCLIPFAVFGFHLFGNLAETVAGKDGSKRKKSEKPKGDL